MPADFPLPIANNPAEPANDSWDVQQQPSTLIALWPGSSAPTQTEILSALEQATGSAPQLLQELHNDEVLWNGVFQTALGETQIIIWAEQAKPLTPEEIDDAAVHACKWALGFETMLPERSSLEQYGNLLRVISLVTDAPAILDPITGRYWRKRELDDLTAAPPSELTSDALWTIHAVNDPESKRASNAWLHTHGLLRCNLPELELLGVPVDQVNAAASLLNAAAEYAIDQGVPPPGVEFEIGQNLPLVLRPWQDCVASLAAGEMGGQRDRQGDDNPHSDISAVLCAWPASKSQTWPADVAKRIAGDDVILYRSPEATERQAQLARQHWSDLATAHAALKRHIGSAGPNKALVLIKAGLPLDNAEHKEHLWFKIKDFRGDSASGELLNQPIGVSNVRSGDIVDLKRELLSDWIVYTQAGRFGPGNIPAMWRAIHALNGA